MIDGSKLHANLPRFNGKGFVEECEGVGAGHKEGKSKLANKRGIVRGNHLGKKLFRGKEVVRGKSFLEAVVEESKSKVQNRIMFSSKLEVSID